MLINNDTIIKDSDPSIRRKSEPVELPLSEENKQILREMFQYVQDSTDEEKAKELNLRPAVGISAIQIGQQGQFVWVLNPETSEVVPMPVQPGEIIGAHQIVTGLHPGQKVVIDGMHKIIPRPGQAPKVKPVYKNIPAAE